MARISYNEMAGLFQRVGISLRAGVDILRAWDTETRRGSMRHRAKMQQIYDKLRAGEGVSESLAEMDGYFPVVAIEMVRVGERTGHLEAVMLKLSEHYRHLIKLRRDFWNSITWPVFELVIALLVIGLLIWITGFLNTGVDMLGWGLVGTKGLMIYLTIVAAIFAVGTLLVYSIASGYWGPMPVLVAMRIPVVGPFLESMALARFTWSLAVAIDAGLEARDSMRMSLRSTHNPVYTAKEETCDRVIERGNEFHEALEEAQVFRNDLLDSMRAADLTGTHTEVLTRLSRDYDERAQAASRRLAFVAACVIGGTVAMLLIYLIFRLAFMYLNPIYEALEWAEHP
jgi:type II secretory pathway component PulF